MKVKVFFTKRKRIGKERFLVRKKKERKLNEKKNRKENYRIG